MEAGCARPIKLFVRKVTKGEAFDCDDVIREIDGTDKSSETPG